MHILIQTFGSAGDVHPFLGLGRALAARGHRVEVAVNEAFAAATEAAGLAPVVVGTEADFKKAADNPDLWHPRKGLELVFRDGVLHELRDTVDALAARVVPGETVLVHSTLGWAARVVRERMDVPLVTAHLSPAAFRTLHRMPKLGGVPLPSWAPRFLKRAFWWISDKVLGGIVDDTLNAVRAEYGLPPVTRIFDTWVHSPDRVVGLFPEWFGPAQPDWPDNYTATGFPLFDEAETRAVDGELTGWLDAGEPPVVFTAGSANVVAHAFFDAAAETCRRLGRRGLLVTSNRDSVPAELPDGVRWESYVPFSRLLPRSAALVSHGGVGTASQALAAGIPHLATPMAYDQFDNASRLQDLGAGDSLPLTKLTPARAAKKLDALLASPDTAAACRTAAAKIAAHDAMDATCRLVEGVR